MKPLNCFYTSVELNDFFEWEGSFGILLNYLTAWIQQPIVWTKDLIQKGSSFSNDPSLSVEEESLAKSSSYNSQTSV